MKLILLIFSLCVMQFCWCQSHSEVVAKINTVEEAESFASNHRDVSVNLVDAENDVFLFDKIDTTNMSSYVGKVETIYRRSTKFLKDTLINLSNIQFVRFNSELIPVNDANLIAKKILIEYNEGNSFWSIMKKYQSKAVVFSSGPVSDAELKNEFNSDFSTRALNGIFLTKSVQNPKYPIVALIRVKSHSVPAFIAISYNEMGGRYSGHFIND